MVWLTVIFLLPVFIQIYLLHVFSLFSVTITHRAKIVCAVYLTGIKWKQTGEPYNDKCWFDTTRFEKQVTEFLFSIKEFKNLNANQNKE